MIKDKLICIDLDNTIISTPESLVNLHNKLNPNNKYTYTNNIDWKFRPMIKTGEELSELFKLFDYKDFYGDTLVVFSNATEVINRLAENNKVIICSKHNMSRRELTKAWINKVMPKVELVFVDNFDDKGKLFDNCYAVIDDRVDALNSFNYNTFKICFGNFQWNQDWNYTRCCGWKDVMLSLNTIYYFECQYPLFSNTNKTTSKNNVENVK